MLILVLLFFGLVILLLANENSRPFAIIAGLLAVIAFLFPFAWPIAGLCIIAAIFRIFF